MKIDVKLLEIYPRNYPREFHYYSSIQKSDFLGTTSGASVRLGFTSDLIGSAGDFLVNEAVGRGKRSRVRRWGEVWPCPVPTAWRSCEHQLWAMRRSPRRPRQ